MILITGGRGGSVHGWGSLLSVEVLTSSGLHLSCSVPPLPRRRNLYTQNGEVVCGGEPTARSCITLTGSDWTTSHQLVLARKGHSSWLSPAGLIMMGGYPSLQTTELLSNTSRSILYFLLHYHFLPLKMKYMHFIGRK